MKKVYALGKGDETVYGVFSSYKKAKAAYDVFLEIEDSLWINDYVLDELEKFFQDVLDGYRWYQIWQHKYHFRDSVSYSNAHISESGLYAFIDGEKDNIVWESDAAVWATIKAKSKEDALKIFEEKLAIAREDESKIHTWTK